MRLRIHAVHADDAHMRIHAHRCACENLDAHQQHKKAKKTTIPHLISPSIYGVMHVLEQLNRLLILPLNRSDILRYI